MRISVDTECDSCHGTGLYIGCSERCGASVVCSTCSGTGRKPISYVPFSKRQNTTKVKRVFRTNPGIQIGENDKIKLTDFGGMPYEDWKDGKPFPAKSEMRKFACPKFWYDRVDSSKTPKWKECMDSLGYCYTDCKCYEQKQKCWERWDKEQEKK